MDLRNSQTIRWKYLRLPTEAMAYDLLLFTAKLNKTVSVHLLRKQIDQNTKRNILTNLTVTLQSQKLLAL